MAKNRRVIVSHESRSGRNLRFRDTSTGRSMSRAEFVKAIHFGTYADNYHVRKVNGVLTPAANPDGKTQNNLG